MEKPNETIYTETYCIIIAPLKARIFKDDKFDRDEFYNEQGVKVILLREKENL